MDPALCRACLTAFEGAGRCPACRSPRTLSHPELTTLAIAHLDCDAFYASVEKRDDPSLRDKPVIIGGGKRGVVSTACYIARIKGVRSAMPMSHALRSCPSLRVVPSRHAVYRAASRQVMARLRALTPLVEPLSIDEAFLDLDAPVARVTMPDIPSPHHPKLMEAALPSPDSIRVEIERLVGF